VDQSQRISPKQLNGPLYELNTYLSLIRKGFRRNIFLKSIRDIYVSGLKPIFVN
jgi:hypothetical protein